MLMHGEFDQVVVGAEESLAVWWQEGAFASPCRKEDTNGGPCAGAAVASKAEDSRIVVSTLPAQAAAGENGRPDAYVQAPQGLFPAPMQQSKAAGAQLYSDEDR